MQGPPSKLAKVPSIVMEEASGSGSGQSAGHAVRPVLPSKHSGKPHAGYMHSSVTVSSVPRGPKTPKTKKAPPRRSKPPGMSPPQKRYTGVRPLERSPGSKPMHWNNARGSNDAALELAGMVMMAAGEHHGQELTMSGGWEMAAGMEAPGGITYMTGPEQDAYIMVDAVTGLPQTHLSPVTSNYFAYGPPGPMTGNPPQQYMPGSPQQAGMMHPMSSMAGYGQMAGLPIASNYAEMMSGYNAAAAGGYYNFSHIPQQQVSPSRQKTSPGFK